MPYVRHVAYATSMMSVCPPVTLVDCDDIVQQKLKSAHGRIDWCFGYLHAKVNPDCNIL